MKLEHIFLAKGKCPLNFLAEQREKTENAWIFLSKEIVEQLKATADSTWLDGSVLMLKWNATEEHADESIQLRTRNVNGQTKWFEAVAVNASDIAFKRPAIDPNEIFFIDRDRRR